MADFEDLFDGTLDTNLTDHTPNVGTAWTGGGSTTDNARLTGNGEIKSEGNESQHTIFSDDTGSADHQIWFQFSQQVSAINARVGCRVGDASNNSYGIAAATDGSVVKLTYRDGGSTNSLVDHSHGMTGSYWIRLKCEGDTVSAWKSQNEPANPDEDTNWTLIGSWTVTVNNTVQTPGLFLFGTSASATNLDPWLDTYKASALTADTTAPTLSSATVDGTALTLTYNEALDEASVPDTGDFTVTGSTSGAISVSGVGVSGTDVNLTLASAVDSSETVDLDYTPGTNPIQDTAGNDAASLTDEPVTNNTAATTVKGVSVTLYDRATQSIRASVTGIVARWWDSPTATGAPLFESTTESTDSNGVLEIDLDSETGLDVGQNGYLVLYKEQSDPESDWHFAARVAIEDIS